MTTTETKRHAALITGASGGIGYDLAKLFAAGGYDLVLVARSAGKLQELAQALEAEHKISTRVIVADLSDQAAPARVFAEVEAAAIDVEVLVNNAGYSVYGPFAETRWKEELDMIQLNVVALTALTKLFLPSMVLRKSGRILNVASTAAFQPGPLMAVYYASKSYVLLFSEAIAEELAGTGVTVTALCPGPTRTGFQARAKMEESKLVRGKKIMGSDEVARIGYAALMKGKRVVVPGAKNRLMANSVRFMPRNMVARTVMKAQAKAGA